MCLNAALCIFHIWDEDTIFGEEKALVSFDQREQSSSYQAEYYIKTEKQHVCIWDVCLGWTNPFIY